MRVIEAAAPPDHGAEEASQYTPTPTWSRFRKYACSVRRLFRAPSCSRRCSCSRLPWQRAEGHVRRIFGAVWVVHV